MTAAEIEPIVTRIREALVTATTVEVRARRGVYARENWGTGYMEYEQAGTTIEIEIDGGARDFTGSHIR